MRKAEAAAVLALLVIGAGCTPREKEQTRQDLRKSGKAVQKELKNDAAFLKEEALKARAETQKGVKKLKKEIKENSDSSR